MAIRRFRWPSWTPSWKKTFSDQYVTWYADRPWPRRHCVIWGPALPRKGAPQIFAPHVYCGQTVAHLIYCWALVFFRFQNIAQITSSLVWRTCHLHLQRRPCGTTPCVLSIQVLSVMAPCTCRAPHACRLADISSCKLNSLMRTSTSVRLKSLFVVIVSQSESYTKS